MNPVTRRNFILQAGAIGLAGVVLPSVFAPSAMAAESFSRLGRPQLKVGVAAYSFRRSFPYASNKIGKVRKEPIDPIDMYRFIDLCARLGCAAELTAYYFPPEVDEEQMLAVRRHAFLRGVSISGSAIGNNFTVEPAALLREIAGVKHWIDLCAALGAPHIRVFAGATEGIDEAEARRRCIGALEECCAYAGSRGIFLGLENHHGIVADAKGMLAILESVKSPWFGANLDTGNFQTDDPYLDIARIAPYAVNVQLKTAILRKGASAKEVTDLSRIRSILHDAHYQGYVALEYEDADAPVGVPHWVQQMQQVFNG